MNIHENARSTPHSRAILVRRVRGDGWSVAQAAKAAPIVFVSHRPNIDRLSMELIDSGDLLVARANANGEVEVPGRMNIP